MAKKQQRWTYFNEDFKHKKVDEFCAWYVAGNSDKIRTINPAGMRKLTEEEKDTYARLNPHLSRYPPPSRGAEGFIGYTVPAELRETVPDEVPQYKEDERFKDLKTLIHRYADIGKTVEENKEAIVQELWTMIALLEEEKRIPEGKGYYFNPFHDAEIIHLKAKMSNLEARLDSIVKFLRENNVAYINWEEKQGWAKK